MQDRACAFTAASMVAKTRARIILQSVGLSLDTEREVVRAAALVVCGECPCQSRDVGSNNGENYRLACTRCPMKL